MFYLCFMYVIYFDPYTGKQNVAKVSHFLYFTLILFVLVHLDGFYSIYSVFPRTKTVKPNFVKICEYFFPKIRDSSSVVL